MLDNSGRVHNAAFAHVSARLHNTRGKQLGSVSNPRKRRHYCSRVTHRYKVPPTSFEALLHAAAERSCVRISGSAYSVGERQCLWCMARKYSIITKHWQAA